MPQFILVLVFLLSLCGLMFLVQKYFKFPLPQVPFLTLILLTIGLYISGLFGIVLYVSYLLFIGGLLYMIYIVYQKFKSKNLDFFTSKTLFPIYVFGLVFFINWIVFKEYIFTQWDEFSFWGIFPKILLSFNDVVGPYNYINKAEYPRIPALLQYYFNLFLSKGTFSEGISIFAQVTFFASALPFFLFHKKKNILLVILIGAIFYCLVNSFGVNSIFIIYNDALLGFLWGMSLILYFVNRHELNRRFISTGILLFAILQVKEIGLVFALCTLFIIGINEIIIYRKNKKIIPILLRISLLLIVIFISKYSWDGYRKYKEIKADAFSISISDVSLSNLKEYQKESKNNFWKALNLRKTDKNNRTFFFSYIDRIVFFLVFAFLSYMVLRKKEVFVNKEFIPFIGSVFICIIGYLFLLCILYMYTFSEFEAVRLASHERYIGTAFLGIYLLILYFIIETKNKWLLLLFAIFIIPLTVNSAFHPFSFKSQKDPFNAIVPVVEKIKKENSNPRIYFINQQGNRAVKVRFGFKIFPISLFGPHSISTYKRDDWGQAVNFQTVISVEEFREKIKTFDYLFLVNSTDFWQQYGQVVKESNLKGIYVYGNNNQFVKASLK